MFLINLEGNDMSEESAASRLFSRLGKPLHDKEDGVITLPIAEYEAIRLDAERWIHFTCNQTALMLGSELDPNDDSVDWYAECNRLADSAIKEGN
jgi:hypothetical protein